MSTLLAQLKTHIELSGKSDTTLAKEIELAGGTVTRQQIWKLRTGMGGGMSEGVSLKTLSEIAGAVDLRVALLPR
jgi:hypothetical protein